MARQTPMGNEPANQQPSWQHPPNHELSYWLHAQHPSQRGPEVDSALGLMAQNYAARRGASAVVAGLGRGLAVATLATLALEAFHAAAVLWLGLAALLLGSLGLFLLLRINSKVPQVRYLSPGRGGTSLRGGVVFGSVMALILCSIAHVVLEPLLDHGVRGVLAYGGYQLAIAITTSAVFMVPSYFFHHARRDLRRFIDSDPQIRAELEQQSLHWVDPVANRPFGPL